MELQSIFGYFATDIRKVQNYCPLSSKIPSGSSSSSLSKTG